MAALPPRPIGLLDVRAGIARLRTIPPAHADRFWSYMLRGVGLAIVSLFCLLFAAATGLGSTSPSDSSSQGISALLVLIFGVIGIGLAFLSASAMLLARSVLRQFDPSPATRVPVRPRSYR